MNRKMNGFTLADCHYEECGSTTRQSSDMGLDCHAHLRSLTMTRKSVFTCHPEEGMKSCVEENQYSGSQKEKEMLNRVQPTHICTNSCFSMTVIFHRLCR